MLKFLVLLAVVASLAVAAPPVVPDFNDIDASPLDASDLDASDLDASDFDASDLGDLDLDDIDDVQEEKFFLLPKVVKTAEEKEADRKKQQQQLLKAITMQKNQPVQPVKLKLPVMTFDPNHGFIAGGPPAPPKSNGPGSCPGCKCVNCK
jgi:hypothetical protein